MPNEPIFEPRLAHKLSDGSYVIFSEDAQDYVEVDPLAAIAIAQDVIVQENNGKWPFTGEDNEVCKD